MGWCDDKNSKFYNKLIKYPFYESSEKLYRRESIYDIIVVIDFNMTPIKKGKGSAIFIHLASKNYKSGGIDPIEKMIYSNKYLPPLLYFGSLAWLIYTFYYEAYLGKEIEIFASASANYILSDVFIFWFIYITWLAVKNLKKKK